MKIISGYEDEITGNDANAPDRDSELSKILIPCTDSFVYANYCTSTDCENTDMMESWDNDDDEPLDDDILLTEADIPGASLDGKCPSELNVVQLKRWLACRGAPVNGKKPELIKRLDHI